MISKIPPALIPGNNEIFLNTTIGIDTAAAELAASENPVSWIFNTLTIGTDSPATATIDVVSTPPIGDLFRIESVLGTFPAIETAASNSPGFGEYDNTGTLAEIADSIANVLNEDIVFNRLFFADSITAPGSVIITAINPGRVYNFTFEGAAVPFTVSSSTPGGDCCFGQSVKDFNLFVDVFAQGAEDYGDAVQKQTMKFITRIQKNYQPDNLHKFDVGGVLRNLVNTTAPGTATDTKFQDATTNYCLMFGFVAKNDNDVNERVITGITSVEWVNNAALALLSNNTLVNYVIEPGAINKNYLSNLPECKIFFEGQADYINYIYKQSTSLVNQVRFYLTPTFYDGTTAAEVLVNTANVTGGQWSYNLANLPIAFIEAVNGKLIKEFIITIRAADSLPFPGGSPVIAQQKYKIQRYCPERFADMVFLNKLGGYDGIRLTERLEQNQRRQVSEFEKTPPFVPQGNETIRGIREAVVECSERWASGWLPESHYTWAKELAESPAVYRQTNEGLKLVIVERVNIDFDDEADKYNIIIDFTPTAPENSVKQ